eukprot:TRINITY_DN1177_c0_g1_i1.p1 TRINITY_DN1177_c0_g1~~TRINITY_DN1177_c0_g1_i1.p1  ORF type:complete len:545 (-),score=129.84 TRINITY_DN1177_c0_g1_i1:47-1681(-)
MFSVARPSDLLKKGSKHLSGLEEAVLKNAEAVKQLSRITRTSLGPNGMKKMIINANQKVFVTSDAATIMKEMEIVHPAAKMAVMAADMQEKEWGDSSNLCVVFCGELMEKAETLLQMGIHPAEVVVGFSKALQQFEQALEGLVAYEIKDLRNVDEVSKVLKSAIGSKQYGYKDLLSTLIAKACIQVLPKNSTNFNVDNVRVAKILGGGVNDTTVIKGMILTRPAEGTIKRVTNAKVAVYAGGLDLGKTETTGKLKIESAAQLFSYTKGEESQFEKEIKSIADAGTKVVVVGGTISEMAMHFLEKYEIMVLKAPSKFELRRICKAIGATPLVRTAAPIPDELGFCDIVEVSEIGSTKVTIFRQEKENSGISTIIVRSATHNSLDDIERAIDDGVNAFKALSRDKKLVAGAGASEIELAKLLKTYSDENPDQEQYAIKQFAEALEVVPRTLAENAGYNASDVISALYAAHSKDGKNVGVDIEAVGDVKVKDSADLGIFDHLETKRSAIRLATNAAVTIIRIDQIIMAKPATGLQAPAPRKGRQFNM